MFFKAKFFFVALLIGFITMSCTSTVHFSKTTEGVNTVEEFDQDLLEKSIMLSLVRFNWTMTESTPNCIKARYSKSNGLIIADIRIEYNENGYSISYEDSRNLDVNLKKMKIHKNYNRWIANLNKSIFEKYIEFHI